MGMIKTYTVNKLTNKFGDIESLDAALIEMPPITQYVIINYYGVNHICCKTLHEIAKELKLPFNVILVHYNNGLRMLNNYIN